jgi:hypothetical protein
LLTDNAPCPKCMSKGSFKTLWDIALMVNLERERERERESIGTLPLFNSRRAHKSHHYESNERKENNESQIFKRKVTIYFVIRQ